MPYITQEDRELIDLKFGFLENMPVGYLNYIITKMLLATRPVNYEDYNSLIGVLECVKLELYRRRVAPYENEKCKLNGDVYE